MRANSSWSSLARHHPIDLVLAECRFAPLEPWRRRTTSDFNAGTLTVALRRGMILQPEKRVQEARFWAFTLGEGLRSGIRQMSRRTRNWPPDVIMLPDVIIMTLLVSPEVAPFHSIRAPQRAARFLRAL